MTEKESKAVWNKKAMYFADLPIQSKDNDYIRMLIGAFKGDLSKARVLDIGCGTGVWSLALADVVGSIVGVDISETMIGYAERNRKSIDADNARFVIADWTDLVVGEGVLADKYDIILIHMSPAVKTLEDLDKAIAVSRGLMLYTASFSLDYPLEEAIERNCSKKSFHGNTDFFYEVLKHVSERGFKPYLGYDADVFHREFDYEEYINDNLVVYPELSRGQLEEAVKPFVKDGKVISHSEMTHITAYWSS